jgi:hypothetical protein
MYVQVILTLQVPSDRTSHFMQWFAQDLHARDLSSKIQSLRCTMISADHVAAIMGPRHPSTIRHFCSGTGGTKTVAVDGCCITIRGTTGKFCVFTRSLLLLLFSFSLLLALSSGAKNLV